MSSVPVCETGVVVLSGAGACVWVVAPLSGSGVENCPNLKRRCASIQFSTDLRLDPVPVNRLNIGIRLN